MPMWAYGANPSRYDTSFFRKSEFSSERVWRENFSAESRNFAEVEFVVLKTVFICDSLNPSLQWQVATRIKLLTIFKNATRDNKNVVLILCPVKCLWLKVGHDFCETGRKISMSYAEYRISLDFRQTFIK